MGTDRHKAKAPRHLRVGILTVSSSRGIAEDESGRWIARTATAEGHTVVFHQVVGDDAAVIAHTLTESLTTYHPDAVIVDGGTGLARADVTIEALRPLFDKELTAFAVLFAQLSFEEIDSAAILSRATAGTIADSVVFCLPGSLKACRLACRELIFPELGHIVGHLRHG
ncbi:MAG TPA: MogA/MoaB family molybdenum cofactor biosynthesis protein [Desulfobacteraceae bacterium]|nr:MogA/MoaB family molybdenum cofactor biosynthesis protein [Deltaproteobacteria bacterium]HDI60512.1 MogA/MoaB family molybdenum cofactor biosynthesis protein [Desulfobacteraceae bacterium]